MLRYFIFILLLVPIDLFSSGITLPDSVGTWIKTGDETIYKGNELYRLIDGGADIYFEYGFTEAIITQYSSGSSYIDVEVYEMLDDAAAYGIFSLISLKTGTPQSLFFEAVAGDGFMIFRKGSFYVSLSGTGTKEEIDFLAQKIALEIQAGTSPPVIEQFRKIFTNAKLVYTRGRLAVSNLDFPAPNILQIKEGIYLEESETKAYIFMFSDEGAADSSYNMLKDEINNKMKKILSKDNLFLFNDNEENTFSCYRINNSIVVSSFRDEKTYDEFYNRITTAID